MAKRARGTLRNKTFRIPSALAARLEKRASDDHRSVNQLVVQLLEQGLPRSTPFGRARILGDRISRTRKAAAGAAPRFTKDELHGDD